MHPDKLVEIVDGIIFAQTGRHLNAAETIVLKGAWLGQTYKHIAENSQYSLATIRNSAGHELWRLFSEALGEKVSKTNFRVVLERKGLISGDSSGSMEGSGDSPKPLKLPVDTALPPREDQKAIAITPQSDSGDVGEAPDGSVFFPELQTIVKKLADRESNSSEKIDIYGENTLAFEIIVPQLQAAHEMFKSIARNPSTILKILREISQNNIDKSPKLATEIIEWLAVNSKSVSSEELIYNLMLTGSGAELRKVLANLEDLNLIEKDCQSIETKYNISSALREKISYKLIAKNLNYIGQKKYLQGELSSAKYYLKKSIIFNPDMAAALYNLGSTYEKLGELSAARDSYKKAMQYDDRAAHAAINNLARLEILAGNIAEAIEKIERILAEVNDTMVKASLHKNLGWAYFEQNRYDEAKQHLQEALKLDNSYVPAHCLLAKVLSTVGEQEEDVLVSWKKCLEYDEGEKPQVGVSWTLPEVDIWKLEARRVLNAKPVDRG